MLKKIVFGVVWFFVFYIAISMLAGGIAGGIAGSKTRDAKSGYEAGARAGAEVGKKYGTYMLIGSMMLAGVGAAAGILPGTRSSSPEPQRPAQPWDSSGV